MKEIIKLFEIIIKNIKILFRSWTTTFLVIIAPLLLILLLGFAFGSNEVHDIKLGIVSESYRLVASVTSILESNNVDLIQITDIEECTFMIMKNELHACAEFSDNFRITEEGPRGTITIYLDNSKLNLIPYLKEYFNEKIGATSEQITLESTEKILGDIEQSVVFMEETRTKLNKFTEDALIIKSQLTTTKKTLEEIKNDLDKVYYILKLAEQSGYFSGINQTTEQFNLDTQEINTTLNSVLYDLSFAQQKIDEISNFTAAIGLNISSEHEMVNAIVMAKGNIIDIQNKLTGYNEKFEQNKKYVEIIPLILQKLEETKLFIETMLVETDKNILIIDNALEEMYAIADDLDKSITKFSSLDKTKAASLLKPIKTVFSPLLENAEKIILIFPIILVFIISFISILLSNITVLKEVNSPAHFRNFLVPVASFSFIFGLYITNLLVILFQIGILLLVAYWRFNIDIFSMFQDFSIAILLITTVFILIGMCIGYAVRSQQTALLLSVFVALTTFLFSDVIFPVEIMPELATTLASMNPLVIGERMFRELLYYNIPLQEQMTDVVLLSVYVIVLSFGTFLMYKYHKRRS
ncbi:ABC transporter permease [Candidatus Woesearchaeota archaeon]|nr:ABC transporter permease [Candidatus Woesearchaeota archaeon]